MQELAKNLILRTPHLSTKQREYWSERVEKLSKDELQRLIKILKNENDNFQKTLFAELSKNATNTDLFEINHIFSETNQDIIREREVKEVQKNTKYLESLIQDLE